MTKDQGAHHSCSYQGQDLFVLEVLGGMHGGFFLDFGASNGISGNNTWMLERWFDWTGVCIEPNDASFRELVKNRSCICLHCCVYNTSGIVDFLEVGGVYGGILQEYDPRHLRYAQQMIGERWPDPSEPPIVPKEARTLRTVLHEANAPAVIDYWSLDTEGSELAILKSFPFDQYRFRVLTVEHNGTAARGTIRQFLEGQGYVLVRDLGIDDAYVWSGELSNHCRSAVWGFIRRERR